MNYKLLTVGALALTALSGYAETYAVCFGINKYPTPVDAKGNPFKDENGNPVSCNLTGAVNDAITMKELFTEKYKIKAENVHVVTDKDAGVDGFIKEMKWLVQTAQPGDQILFSFSGHGSQLPDKTKPNGKASVIVLADDELVPGEFFKKLSTSLKGAGINSTFVFDSCFSGGMSRQALRFNGSELKEVRTRSLNASFGTSGSPIASNGPLPLSAKAHLGSEANFLKSSGATVKARAKAGTIRGEVAFIFASNDQQTSSDLSFKDPEKKAHGLFTLMLEMVLSKGPELPIGEVVTAINDFITKNTDFKQRPGTEFSNEERSKRPLVFDN